MKSIFSTINNIFENFQTLSLKDKVDYIDNIIEFFKICKKISKNEKKIILKILEKLVTMSTYSDDNKLKLKLLICYLESTLD